MDEYDSSHRQQKDDEANSSCSTTAGPTNRKKKRRRTNSAISAEEEKEKESIIRSLNFRVGTNGDIYGTRCWTNLSEKWKNDPDVAYEAWKEGIFAHVDCDLNDYRRVQYEACPYLIPTPACLDRAFFERLAAAADADSTSRCSFLWPSLPAHLEEETTNNNDDGGVFLQSVLHLLCVSCLRRIYRNFPSLFNDRNVWVRMVNNRPAHHELYRLSDLFRDFAPYWIRCCDREIMEQACHIDYWCLQLFVDGTPLSRDEALHRQVLERDPQALVALLRETQRRFPLLFPKYLKPFYTYYCVTRYENRHENDLPFGEDDSIGANFDALAECVDPELWQDREFVKTWCQTGLPFGQTIGYSEEIGETLVERYRDDAEIFRLVAEHCHPEFRVQSFSSASQKLRGDKTFMLQAAEHDCRLCRCAATNLYFDFHLLVLAFSEDDEAASYYLRGFYFTVSDDDDDSSEYQDPDQEEFPRFLRHLVTKIRELLNFHETFVKTVLCGICVERQNSHNHCGLSILNQGHDTSVHFQQLIAQFLDLPTGKHLRRLRVALENVADTFAHSARYAIDSDDDSDGDDHKEVHGDEDAIDSTTADDDDVGQDDEDERDGHVE